MGKLLHSYVPEGYLVLRDWCAKTGVPYNVAYRLINQRKLPYVRVAKWMICVRADQPLTAEMNNTGMGAQKLAEQYGAKLADKI